MWPEGRCSAADLVQLYDQLAIPHFQRGLVWRTDSVSLLLESLYHQTPCGSILLWKPEDPASHGVALGSRLRFLVIDGQQRVRSLHGIFGPMAAASTNRSGETDGEHTDDGDPSPDAVWCVNLAQLPELPTFQQGKVSRFRLFGRHQDPLQSSKDDKSARFQEQRRALLPLRWFLDRAIQPDSLRADSAGTLTEGAVEAVLGNPVVFERLQGIRTNVLFDVRILGPDQSLAEVVSAYNRINSAGKPVEAEERAFATLVSVTDKAELELKSFFAATRGPSTHATSAQERDDLLQREKESRFGFKLFMRAFVINYG